MKEEVERTLSEAEAREMLRVSTKRNKRTPGSKKYNKRQKRHTIKARGKKWCRVYALREFANGPFYYVGQTQLTLEERLSWHHKTIAKSLRMGRNLSPAQEWFRLAVSKGCKPIIVELDGNGILNISEAVWIDRLSKAGHPLKNIESRVSSELPEFGEIIWEDK